MNLYEFGKAAKELYDVLGIILEQLEDGVIDPKLIERIRLAIESYRKVMGYENE